MTGCCMSWFLFPPYKQENISLPDDPNQPHHGLTDLAGGENENPTLPISFQSPKREGPAMGMNRQEKDGLETVHSVAHGSSKVKKNKLELSWSCKAQPVSY